MANFPTQIPDWESHNSAFLDLLFSSDTGICSAMAFLPLGNSDHVVFSVSIHFLSNSKWNARFILQLSHCISHCCANWDGLCDHWRDVPWEDIFKISATGELCEWAQVGIDKYISHHNIRSSLSPWFSAACATAIFHRNHFFLFFSNRINFLNLNSSSDRIVNVVKGFLKLPNVHMLIKQNSPSLPRNFALGTFGELLIYFSIKVNMLYLD